MLRPICALLCFIFLSACGSDKLTDGLAEDLIEDCMTSMNYNKTKSLSFGKLSISEFTLNRKPDLLQSYTRLQELGLGKIVETGKSKEGIFSDIHYEISYNDIALKHRSEEKENEEESDEEESDKKASKESNKYTFKVCDYKLGEIVDIHENPSTNEAMVNFTLIRQNETPFLFVEEEEKYYPKELRKTVMFKKMNSGWKACK